MEWAEEGAGAGAGGAGGQGAGTWMDVGRNDRNAGEAQGAGAWSRVLVNKVICQNKADPLYSLMWLEQRQRNVWEQSDGADDSQR